MLFALVCVLPPQLEPLSLMLRIPVAALRHSVDPVPVEPMAIFVTDSGLAVYVPTTSELTWDAALPSTPMPNAYLRLRCPESLACGFSVDAER